MRKDEEGDGEVGDGCGVVWCSWCGALRYGGMWCGVVR